MPDFQSLFEQNNCRPVLWNGKLVCIEDRWPCSGGERYVLRFISATDSRPQAASLTVIGGYGLVVDGIHVSGPRKDSILWYHLYKDLDVNIVIPKYSKKVDTIFSVMNAWDQGLGRIESGHGGAAMIVTERIDSEGVQRLYRCNDFDPDDDFDDLVFTITRIK